MNKLGEDVHINAWSGSTKDSAIETIKAALDQMVGPNSNSVYDKTLPILLVRKDDESSKKELAKRVHDIRGALRTLSLAVDSIKEGYKFSDNMAEAKIAAMLKAVAILDRESKSSVALLSRP